MKGYQVYNLVWLMVWALIGIGGLFGIIKGNWFHLVTLAGGIYFSFLLFVEDEDGESLKDFAVRMVKQYSEGK